MANGTAAVPPATRRTQRETLFIPITPVDERRFESEMRRIDATVSDEKMNREKSGTQIEKSVNDLRGEMKDLRVEMNSRFEKVDGEIKNLRGEMKDLRGEMNSRFEKVDGEIKNLRVELNTRVDRLDDRLWWIFGAVVLSILLPIVMKYL
jgi:chromosome segregation ATPase